MVIDVIYFVAVVAIVTVTAQPKLIGGEKCHLGEFPYMISMTVFGEHECGGTIISKRFVLTAAHCFDKSLVNDPSPLSIQYGIVDKTEQRINTTVKVRRVIMHGEYFPPPERHPNDIALLELEENIAFGPNVQPVKLPNQDFSPGDNITVTLIGWGRIGFGLPFSSNLLKVNVTLISSQYCQHAYENDFYYPQLQLCAGYDDAETVSCNGDSGGPVTLDGVQFGIVSWGSNICAVEAPTIFTNVAYYRNWIKENSGV